MEEENNDPGYTAPFTINGQVPTFLVRNAGTEKLVRLADGTIATIPQSQWDRLPELALEVDGVIPIPEAVSMAQARTVLLEAGMLDAVDMLVNSQTEQVKIAWNWALELRRDSPTVVALAYTMKMTEEQMDDLFRAASQVRF